VRRAREGDHIAYGELYLQYSKAMFNICMRMMGRREAAEDVLQDAFVLAYKKLGQLADESRFGGWLKKIVINECIRQSRRVQPEPIPEYYMSEVAEEKQEEWFRDVSVEEIERCIESLPDGYRQVFTLYAIEEYSHKEIAELMQITESTSKSQYHRARQLLKKNLTGNKKYG
jgi:RNA polymerase sigma factor (sigma-70 family)